MSVKGVNSTNPYIVRLLQKFDNGNLSDLASFMQELENKSPSPYHTDRAAAKNRAHIQAGREYDLLRPRPNKDTVEISEEAYEAFRRMQREAAENTDMPDEAE